MPKEQKKGHGLRKFFSGIGARIAEGSKKRGKETLENHIGLAKDALRKEGFTHDEVDRLVTFFMENPDHELADRFLVFESLFIEEKADAVSRFRELLESIEHRQK